MKPKKETIIEINYPIKSLNFLDFNYIEFQENKDMNDFIIENYPFKQFFTLSDRENIFFIDFENKMYFFCKKSKGDRNEKGKRHI